MSWDYAYNKVGIVGLFQGNNIIKCQYKQIDTFYIKRKAVATKSNKYNDTASKNSNLFSLQPDHKEK